MQTTEMLSGEVKDVSRAKYNGLEFIVTLEGRCHLRGSIHKFFNYGKHNANRFTHSNLIQVVKQLESFGIIADKTIVKSFEFGLNLFLENTKIQPSDIYDSIIYSKGVTKSQISDKGKNRGYIFKGSDRELKAYEKYDNAKPLNVCRIEEKFKKMRSVSQFNIISLSDLLKPKTLTSLFNDRLLLRIEQSVVYEYKALKTTHRLPKRYKSVFKDLRNPEIWIKGFTNSQVRKQKKQLLEKIICKYSKRDIKKDLIELLVNEFQNCMDVEILHTANNNAAKSITNALIDKGCKLLNPVTPRYCQTCGKDISHQRKGSKFCTDQRKCRDKAYNRKKQLEKRIYSNNEIENLVNVFVKGGKLKRLSNEHKINKYKECSMIVTSTSGLHFLTNNEANQFTKQLDKKIIRYTGKSKSQAIG